MKVSAGVSTPAADAIGRRTIEDETSKTFFQCPAVSGQTWGTSFWCCARSWHFLVQTPEAGDWTRFRGPNGSGVSTSQDLPLRFGPRENVLWRTSLPPGHSSPVFSRESIFVTGFQEDSLSTTALDRKTGKIRWTRDVARNRKGELHRDNSPASPSPVTDGSNVYVFFQDLGLLAYDARGNELWRVAMDPVNTPFGIGASPVLAGDHVVQVCDGESGSYMVAVDKNTGQVAWRDERPLVRRGFSTPVLYRPQGGELQVLVPGIIPARRLFGGGRERGSGGAAD